MRPPEKLTIDTPEQIALEFPLAGAGSRFLALAIDTFVQLAIVARPRARRRSSRSGSARSAISRSRRGSSRALILLGFLLYYGYFAAFEALWGGQTPGKRAVGLRVISVTGQPITTFDALLRNLLRIVDQMPGIYAVGVLSIFFTARNQRLGDLVAGTVVVQEHGLPRGRAVQSTPPTATRLGAARLSDRGSRGHPDVPRRGAPICRNRCAAAPPASSPTASAHAAGAAGRELTGTTKR